MATSVATAQKKIHTPCLDRNGGRGDAIHTVLCGVNCVRAVALCAHDWPEHGALPHPRQCQGAPLRPQDMTVAKLLKTGGLRYRLDRQMGIGRGGK